MTKTALAHLRNRKLGFVFQGFNLLKRMSAVENVELPLVYSGMSPQRGARRRWRMLELVGLKQRAHHLPNQLSGGQQQRVAIARALVNEPQILFADEPTGNLDSKTGQEILAEFERLNRELGQTIVMVTHDPAVAEQAPRQITVKDGLIASDVRRADVQLTPLSPPGRAPGVRGRRMHENRASPVLEKAGGMIVTVCAAPQPGPLTRRVRGDNYEFPLRLPHRPDRPAGPQGPVRA